MNEFIERLAVALAEHKVDDLGTKQQEMDKYFEEYLSVLEGAVLDMDDLSMVELVHMELGTETIIEELNFVADDFYGSAIKAFYKEEGAGALVQLLGHIAEDVVAVKVDSLHTKRELTSFIETLT